MSINYAFMTHLSKSIFIMGDKIELGYYEKITNILGFIAWSIVHEVIV